MKVRFAAGISHAGSFMTLQIKTDGWPKTDEQAAAHIQKYGGRPVIAEIELPDPLPLPPIELVEVDVKKHA